MPASGTYADGQSARTQPVQVQAGARGLRILDAHGAALAEWKYRGLELAEPLQPPHPVRLLHRTAGPATLTFPPAEWERLLAEAPALRRQFGGSRWLGLGAPRLGLIAVGGLAAIVLLVWLLPLAAAGLAQWVPKPWREALGRQGLQALNAQFPPCVGPGAAAGLGALQGLADRFTAVAQPPMAAGEVRVHVADAPISNALALPGGQIVVFRGMIRLAQTPEELAGVLAHEVAHGLRHHPTQAWLRSAGLAMLMRVALGGSQSDFSARLAETLVLLRYSRGDEAEADRLGAQLLDRAGLAHGGLARLLARLQRETGREGPAFLSSHPLTEERLQALAALGADRPGLAAPFSPGAWDAVRALCAAPRGARRLAALSPVSRSSAFGTSLGPAGPG